MKKQVDPFDQPVSSNEYQRLAATIWMGGDLLTVRYWLGRILRHNLLREPDHSVKVLLKRFCLSNGYDKGSLLVDDYQSWPSFSLILQHEVEQNESDKKRKNLKLIAAIQAMLTDPELTDSELASIAKTTEKQIARMSNIAVLRKAWKLRSV